MSRRALGIAAAAVAVALVANAFFVDGITRAAAPRDGGRLVDTTVAQANVRIEGQGPPVVLIHGISAALDWWDDIVPALAARHRVIRIDLIGHGGTAAPVAGYEIPRQAALVASVIDAARADRVAVIGHSMGGQVAIALTEARPALVERVVLIDSPPTTDAGFDLATRAYLLPVVGQALSYLRTDAMVRRSLAQGFAPGFAVPERFVADVQQVTYTAFRSSYLASFAFRRDRPAFERLAGLRPMPPLLVIFGTRDQIVPVGNAKLYERVPGVHVVMVDGAGHSPMVEAPARTLELIEPFLDGAPHPSRYG